MLQMKNTNPVITQIIFKSYQSIFLMSHIHNVVKIDFLIQSKFFELCLCLQFFFFICSSGSDLDDQ